MGKKGALAGAKNNSSRMISQERFEFIKKEHGRYASWAVWADEGEKPTSNIGNLSVFNEETNNELFDILRPDIIFVALNFSRDAVAEPLANFHSAWPYAKDHKIRYAISDSPFWGGYMTDLIKNHSEVKSSVVKKMLDKNPAIVADNIEILHHEIDALGVEKPTLIAFGRTVEKHLRNNFKDYSIIYIPHYSAGGNNPNGRLNNRDNYKNEVRKILVREYNCSPWP